MVEEKKISNIENNILNEEAVLNKEGKKVEEISKEISERKVIASDSGSFIEKSLTWLKNPYHLALVGILVFAVVIRFYYFWMTKNQPLWWDESEYMSQAKAIAGLVNYDVSSVRTPLFPAFMSIFFFLGIANEAVMRFFGLFIPSILVIVLTYFMVKEMYSDKRIALISTLIMAVLWENLFYSNRFHTENMALIFQFFAIFIFFKCYMKNQNFYFIKTKYSLVWIIVLSVLSFLSRPGNVMFVPALFVFILLLNKDKILTKTGILSILALIIALIISFFVSEKPMSLLKSYVHFSDPVGWNSLSVFYGFYQSLISNLPSILFYAFLIGLVIVIFKTILILDQVKKLKLSSENLEFKSDLFNLLLLLGVLFVFIFLMRANTFEYRWFFPLLPAMLVFTSKGVINFSDYAASLAGKKSLAILLLLLIVILGAYTQVYHADQIIKNKVDSYSQVRDAALWLKENYPKNTQVLSRSYPQTVYYSELNVSTFSPSENETDFDIYLNANKPELLEVSAFETNPKWIYDWSVKHNDTLKSVKVYTQNTAQGSQPVLIVYELTY